MWNVSFKEARGNSVWLMTALRTVPEDRPREKVFPGWGASSLSQEPPTERNEGVGSVGTSPSESWAKGLPVRGPIHFQVGGLWGAKSRLPLAHWVPSVTEAAGERQTKGRSRKAEGIIVKKTQVRGSFTWLELKKEAVLSHPHVGKTDKTDRPASSWRVSYPWCGQRSKVTYLTSQLLHRFPGFRYR